MNTPAAFVTYGWCRVSYVIVHSLASRGVPVHVGDVSKLAMCRYSRLPVSFSRYRSPYRDPQGFVNDLAEGIKAHGATVLIPGHEDSLAISRWRHLLPPDLKIALAPTEVLERAVNKWEILSVANEAGVPVPESYKPESLADAANYAKQCKYPKVIKTQIGNSAKGVFVVNDSKEFVSRYEWLINEYHIQPPKFPIAQEYVNGTGYGVCLLYNHGKFRASFCERYIRCKDGDVGTSVFRESVDVPLLVNYSRALMDHLGWHGVAHLDFIMDEETGKAALIEINPRFWGALDLAVRSGVDFPWLLYRMLVDGDIEPVSGYKIGVKSRWLVGEMLHLLNQIRRRPSKMMKSVMDIVSSRSDGCDDFRLSDPLPLFFEMLYYGTRFIATASANPIEEGMIA